MLLEARLQLDEVVAETATTGLESKDWRKRDSAITALEKLARQHGRIQPPFDWLFPYDEGWWGVP